MNETQIIARVKGGSTNDFAELVERYHVGLIIYCDRLVHNRMEAEDIAQKSFIKAYERLHTFNPEKGDSQHGYTGLHLTKQWIACVKQKEQLILTILKT